MQKPSLSLQPKSKPYNFCPTITLQTQFSTVQPQFSDIDNVQLVSEEDQLKMSHCKAENETFRRDSVHLEIQLDDGKVQTIFPKINDNPFHLARSFCQQHQLDEQMLAILTDNIRNTIEKLKKNENKSKKQRFATEPAEMCLKQPNPKKFDTTAKNYVKDLRDFAKKKQKFQGQINESIESQSFLQNPNNKKSSNKPNPLQQKVCNLKPPHKSIKRQHSKTYESVTTQTSIKTEAFDDKEFRKELLNKENQLHTVFDYLYQDSRLKQLKKKDKIQVFMKRNCNFKPQINATSRKIVENCSFEQRIKKSVQKSSEKDIKNKKVVSSSVQSSKSSLPKHYFKLESCGQSKKPAITYSLKNLTKKTHPSLTKPYVSVSSSTKNLFSKPLHPSKNTQKMYENQKQKAFRSVFLLLDDDNDGVISILNINLINGIEQKLIQILFPVLEELEILETQLNQDQFCCAIDKLFGSLSVEQKGYLLKYYQKLEKQQKNRLQSEPLKVKYSLKQPTMTPISSQLVTQTERNNVSVYEYSMIRQQLKQQKLQHQRIMKERSLMRNCTFHPKTNPKRPIYF